MFPQGPVLTPNPRPEHLGHRPRETRIPLLTCMDEVFGQGNAQRRFWRPLSLRLP